jgi:hypothetical protein
MPFDYAQSGFHVRDNLPQAFRWAWETIARPGNWWRGEDRVAIAGETRSARSCPLCAQRKAALSPFALPGTHESVSNLPAAAVDSVHRIVTDPSRLTKSWLQGLEADGLTDGHYVELLGIVVTVVSIDAFHRALGLPLEALPAPQTGEPSGYRPAGARDHGAWVPTVAAADLTEAEADLYGGAPQTGNVLSAMSLVPDSVRLLNVVSEAQYMPGAHVVRPQSNYGRALSRAQIELLAGRVSSLSDCFY